MSSRDAKEHTWSATKKSVVAGIVVLVVIAAVVVSIVFINKGKKKSHSGSGSSDPGHKTCKKGEWVRATPKGTCLIDDKNGKAISVSCTHPKAYTKWTRSLANCPSGVKGAENRSCDLKQSCCVCKRSCGCCKMKTPYNEKFKDNAAYCKAFDNKPEGSDFEAVCSYKHTRIPSSLKGLGLCKACKAQEKEVCSISCDHPSDCKAPSSDSQKEEDSGAVAANGPLGSSKSKCTRAAIVQDSGQGGCCTQSSKSVPSIPHQDSAVIQTLGNTNSSGSTTGSGFNTISWSMDVANVRYKNSKNPFSSLPISKSLTSDQKNLLCEFLTSTSNWLGGKVTNSGGSNPTFTFSSANTKYGAIALRIWSNRTPLDLTSDNKCQVYITPKSLQSSCRSALSNRASAIGKFKVTPTSDTKTALHKANEAVAQTCFPITSGSTDTTDSVTNPSKKKSSDEYTGCATTSNSKNGSYNGMASTILALRYQIETDAPGSDAVHGTTSSLRGSGGGSGSKSESQVDGCTAANAASYMMCRSLPMSEVVPDIQHIFLSYVSDATALNAIRKDIDSEDFSTLQSDIKKVKCSGDNSELCKQFQASILQRLYAYEQMWKNEALSSDPSDFNNRCDVIKPDTSTPSGINACGLTTKDNKAVKQAIDARKIKNLIKLEKKLITASEQCAGTSGTHLGNYAIAEVCASLDYPELSAPNLCQVQKSCTKNTDGHYKASCFQQAISECKQIYNKSTGGGFGAGV